MVESSPALALVLVQHKSMADDGSALGERNAEKDRWTLTKNQSSPIWVIWEMEGDD